MPRPGRWVAVGELVRSWGRRAGMAADRLAILGAVWDREFGHMERQWRLLGVRRGVLYVLPRSPSAAMELRMRGDGIIRTLNKHFRTAWIKGVKPSARRPDDA